MSVFSKIWLLGFIRNDRFGEKNENWCRRSSQSFHSLDDFYTRFTVKAWLSIPKINLDNRHISTSACSQSLERPKKPIWANKVRWIIFSRLTSKTALKMFSVKIDIFSHVGRYLFVQAFDVYKSIEFVNIRLITSSRLRN